MPGLNKSVKNQKRSEMGLLTQLDRLCNIEKLSVIDIKFYLYLHKHCKRSGFIPGFTLIAKELKCNVGSLYKSYERLKDHKIISEQRKKKIGYSWCYEFEFVK